MKRNIYTISGHDTKYGDGYSLRGVTDTKFTNKAKAIKVAKYWLKELGDEEGWEHRVTVYSEDENGNGKGVWSGTIKGK